MVGDVTNKISSLQEQKTLIDERLQISGSEEDENQLGRVKMDLERALQWKAEMIK